MALYEVNIKCHPDVRDEFLVWLKEEHLADMLKVPGFQKASVYTTIVEEEWAEGVPKHKQEIVAVYELENEAALKTYIEVHAPKMRGLLPEKFQGKLKFIRRMMKKEA